MQRLYIDTEEGAQAAYMPRVRELIGSCFVRPTSREEDLENAADLKIVPIGHSRRGDVAARLRNEWYRQYAHEFTIRCWREGGIETELSKILRGCADYFFYGFKRGDRDVYPWFLGNLAIFRAWYGSSAKPPGRVIENQDNSSAMLVLSVSEMPDAFFIRREA